MPLKCISNNGTTTYGGVKGSGSSYEAVLVLVVLSDSVQIEKVAADTSVLHRQLFLYKGDTLTMRYAEWTPPYAIDAFMKKPTQRPPKFHATGHQKVLENFHFEKLVYTYHGTTSQLTLPAREEDVIETP